MPRKHRAPISSFDPLLFQFWRDALRARNVAPCETEAKAIRLRYRLYELRASMRAEDHPDTCAAERISLRIEIQPDGRYAVIGDSADSEFKSALVESGAKIPDAPSLADILKKEET